MRFHLFDVYCEMRADNPGTSTAIYCCFYFSPISFPYYPSSQRSFPFLPLRLLAPFYLFHQSTSFSFFRELFPHHSHSLELFPGCQFWPCQPLCAQQSSPSLPPFTAFNCPRCPSLGNTSLPVPPGQPNPQGKGDASDWIVSFPLCLLPQSRWHCSPEHRTHFRLWPVHCHGQFVQSPVPVHGMEMPSVCFSVLVCLLAQR